MEHTYLKPADRVSLVAPIELISERIDQYLARLFTAHSRTFFQKLITQGCITINDTQVTKPSTVLKACDTITITMPSPLKRSMATAQAKNLAIEVLYEHEHFLIINKPAGLLVHQPHAHASEVTVVDWLLTHYNEFMNQDDLIRPGIVHRLDKDTSGLLIIARTAYAHGLLSTLFKEHAINKTYLALVEGLPPTTGTITTSIGRHPLLPTKMTVMHSGRKALTHYRVQEYLNTCSLLEVRPITGRTHQIRVHCASIQHPLIGDKVYGSASLIINRQALHAHALTFTFEGKSYEFSKEPPLDFHKALVALREA